jgi:hypothetical protein
MDSAMEARPMEDLCVAPIGGWVVGGPPAVQPPIPRPRPRQESSTAQSADLHFTSMNLSVDHAPRVPALKLSMKRTHRRSSGTVVPPDVTTTTGRCSMPASLVWRERKATSESFIAPADTGQLVKKSSTALLAILRAVCCACAEGGSVAAGIHGVI